MRIDAYIGNPIIATQQDYYELEELLHEVEPDCHSVQLRQEVSHQQTPYRKLPPKKSVKSQTISEASPKKL